MDESNRKSAAAVQALASRAEKAGITKAKLAEQIGTSYASFKRYLNGATSPTLTQWLDLTDYVRRATIRKGIPNPKPHRGRTGVALPKGPASS